MKSAWIDDEHEHEHEHEKTTYYPEQPPLHRKHRDHVAHVQCKRLGEERRQPQRTVPVHRKQSHRPEDALDRQVHHVDHEMEREESSRAAIQTGHKVHDDVEEEDSRGADGQVCDGVR